MSDPSQRTAVSLATHLLASWHCQWRSLAIPWLPRVLTALEGSLLAIGAPNHLHCVAVRYSDGDGFRGARLVVATAARCSGDRYSRTSPCHRPSLPASTRRPPTRDATKHGSDPHKCVMFPSPSASPPLLACTARWPPPSQPPAAATPGPEQPAPPPAVRVLVLRGLHAGSIRAAASIPPAAPSPPLHPGTRSGRGRGGDEGGCGGEGGNARE